MEREGNFTKLIVLLIVISIIGVEGRPSSYQIENIPYHRQITRYACGDASFEMVYHHYRQDLDQRAIIDVARTSFAVGTNTFDLIRAAHFSSISSSPVNYFYPSQAPSNGWKKTIPRGMISFGYYSSQCWIEELKDIIAQGYPIIVLNHFSMTSPGGHFRVAMGYNESSITLLDPWDRDWPRIISFSNEEFCEEIWKIPEDYSQYNITSPPYWGGFIAPLSVDLSFNALNESRGFDQKQFNFIEVNSTISYPCPDPFCSSPHINNLNSFEISNFNVTLQLPFNMKIKSGNPITSFPSLLPKSSIQLTWQVEIDDSIDIKFPSSSSSSSSFSSSSSSSSFYNEENFVGESVIKVEVEGMISGEVPEAVCCYDKDGSLNFFPSYSYSDIVGDFAQIHY